MLRKQEKSTGNKLDGVDVCVRAQPFMFGLKFSKCKPNPPVMPLVLQKDTLQGKEMMYC